MPRYLIVYLFELRNSSTLSIKGCPTFNDTLLRAHNSNIKRHHVQYFHAILRFEFEFFKRGASEAAEGCLASVAAKLVKTVTKIFDSHFPIYMCVEINRAGVFGPKIFHFRTLTCNSHFPIYMRVEINRAGVFGPTNFPFSYANL